VEQGNSKILLDCGTGVFANLMKRVALHELSAVFLTHMHPDHFLDLVPLSYALTYGKHQRSDALPVYVPPGGKKVWGDVVTAFAGPVGALLQSLALSEYPVGGCRLGTLEVQVVPVQHFDLPSYGIQVSGRGKLAYSGDTGPCPALPMLAHEADLLLCEATLLHGDALPQERGHLTAREAGELAQKAGARRLLLTHIAPHVDARKSLAEAKAAFLGEVLLAEEGHTYDVSAEHQNP
jgi:ribonuclease BN (tRNA processing enzyme)